MYTKYLFCSLSVALLLSLGVWLVFHEGQNVWGVESNMDLLLHILHCSRARPLLFLTGNFPFQPNIQIWLRVYLPVWHRNIANVHIKAETIFLG